MSLEKKYQKNLDQKGFDSYKIPSGYSNKAESFEKSEISLKNYNYCLDSLSSQLSEDSKGSIEIDGLRFSQEIEKILAKHLKQSSIVENNVTNNYKDMLEGLKQPNLHKISENSYEDTQKEIPEKILLVTDPNYTETSENPSKQKSLTTT